MGNFYPKILLFFRAVYFCVVGVVMDSGEFDLLSIAMSSKRSNQLSYAPITSKRRILHSIFFLLNNY